MVYNYFTDQATSAHPVEKKVETTELRHCCRGGFESRRARWNRKQLPKRCSSASPWHWLHWLKGALYRAAVSIADRQSQFTHVQRPPGGHARWSFFSHSCGQFCDSPAE